MRSAIISLILAYILSLTGVDLYLIEGAYEVIGLTISRSGYYFIFFMIGLVFDLIDYFRRR
jgi:uncharacterized membrane protein YiaA